MQLRFWLVRCGAPHDWAGMETYALEPEELATALQRRFQSSASVAKLPGKAADTGKEIALQVYVLFSCLPTLSPYARSSDTHPEQHSSRQDGYDLHMQPSRGSVMFP